MKNNSSFPDFEKWVDKGGREIFSRWVTASSYSNLSPITQAYGVCFTEDGKVLVVKDLRDWIIPGGTLESGESPEETLKREVFEEATVVINQNVFIGYHEVKIPNNSNLDEGDHFFQLRYAALIKEVKPLQPDPCSGRTMQRIFIAQEEFNDYVKWRETGKKMFEEAQKKFKRWEEKIR